MRFEYGVEQHDAAAAGLCMEMFHPELRDGPNCREDLNHDGMHKGLGVLWPEEPQVEVSVAQRFLAAYRRIPNSYHEVFLENDGSVSMSMLGFEAAVRFVGVRSSED